MDLEVPGFGKAAVAVPIGASSPRAIVIALHGAADRPEWACSVLRSIAGPAPFVLCPRGVQRTDFPASDARYTFGAVDATASELRAALHRAETSLRAVRRAGPGDFYGFRDRRRSRGRDHQPRAGVLFTRALDRTLAQQLAVLAGRAVCALGRSARAVCLRPRPRRRAPAEGGADRARRRRCPARCSCPVTPRCWTRPRAAY